MTSLSCASNAIPRLSQGVGPRRMKHRAAEKADMGKRPFRTGGASDPKCQAAMAELYAGG